MHGITIIRLLLTLILETLTFPSLSNPVLEYSGTCYLLLYQNSYFLIPILVTLLCRIYDHNEYMELRLSNGHLLSHNYSSWYMEEMITFIDILVQTELQR